MQSPTVRSFIDAKLDDVEKNLLKLHYSCQNQTVDRRVKVVTKASLEVVLFKRKDCLKKKKQRYKN